MSDEPPPNDGEPFMREVYVRLPDGTEVHVHLPDGRDIRAWTASVGAILDALTREPSPMAMLNLVAIVNHAAAGLLALAPEEARRELSAAERAELADDLRRDAERIVAWLVP